MIYHANLRIITVTIRNAKKFKAMMDELELEYCQLTSDKNTVAFTVNTNDVDFILDSWKEKGGKVDVAPNDQRLSGTPASTQ